MRIHCIRYLITILFFTSVLKGQLDNSALLYNSFKDTLKKDDVYFRLQGLGFLKNNENFGPMQDGYTLFGYQFNPQLGYQLSEELALEGGVYLQKDFGNPNFNSIDPTFSLKYRKKNFKMIFGTLEGSLNHRLIEPLYGFERVMTNRMENGVQFMMNKPFFDFDLWIDWQTMLYKLVDDYERFWLGFSSNAFKYSKNDFGFNLPLQATARHNGGQIARGGFIGKDNEGVYTNLNAAGGIYVEKNFERKGLRKLYFDTRYVLNKNNSRDSSIYKKFSDGMMANIGMNVFGTDVMLTYWYGSDYTSEFGADTYWSSSTSVTYAGTYVSYRNLAILRVTKTFKLADNASMTLRLEPMYDIDFGRFQYSYGLYLNFDKKIKLTK